MWLWDFHQIDDYIVFNTQSKIVILEEELSKLKEENRHLLVSKLTSTFIICMYA